MSWDAVSLHQHPPDQKFFAIYLAASGKGGISFMRLSKQIDIFWITACRMLRKIRMPWVIAKASIACKI
jgi:hypothetical protein